MNWAQLKTILWLRWRLTRNQWAKSGGIGAVLAAIVAFAMLVLGLLGFLFGIGIGAGGLGKIGPNAAMFIWLGLTVAFLFFWLIGLLQELQRSETIDLQRLLHLPVQLGQIFVINYLASHLALSIAVVAPTMIGMAIGMAWTRGPSMLLLIPLGLSMIFMITAWTYYVRGWLAAMMTNPRRRRAVIMGVSFGVILLVQAPNIYFNLLNRHDGSSKRRSQMTAEERAADDADDQRKLNQLVAIEKYVPPLWVPAGAKGLAEGTMWPALAGLLGCFAIGTLGLRRAYVSTVKFYQGTTGGKAAVRAPSQPVTRPRAAAATSNGRQLIDRSIPFVPEQASALAVASLRSMLRAPEVKMQMGVSFLILLLMGGSILFRASANISAKWQPFAATGVVIFSLFFMIQFLTNLFGLDRDGFRALVLSPADRRLLLLGKNVATLPVPMVSAFVLLTMVSIWLKLSPLIFLACVFQLVAAVLVLGIGGNLLSILLPYRIQPGSMKATKMPGLNIFFIVLAQFVFPAAMSPLFLAPLIGQIAGRAGGPAGLVTLAVSIVLMAISAWVYWQTLGPLGRLLQKRETKILGVVTVEVE